MITARELVFYIRAEDQASRVVKRVGKSFGSLANIRDLEAKASKQQLTNLNNIDKAQLRIARNNVTLQRAQVQAERLNKLASSGKAMKGYTIAQTATMADAATKSVANLVEQERLLAISEDEVRKAGDAASASIDRQINEAKIARVNNYATAFSNVARAIRLFGVVAGASLIFAAHQAAQFQTQLSLAATQARPAGAGANATLAIQGRLQNVVLKQMQEFPATSKEMADSLYQIFSGTNIQGIPKATGLLKLFNKAAVAGQVDLGSITDAGITLFNNFVGKGKEFNNINQALQVFFSAVRYGRMNVEQFANSLSNVVSSGVAAGNNFKDIADAMAALTRQTGAARTGRDATGLARLYEMLVNPDVVSGLKKIGVNEVDPLTNKLKPLLQIITEIKAKADLKGINAVNFFKTISALGSGLSGNKGTIQGRRAFQYLIQDLTNYQKVSRDVNNDNNEFTKSYEALSKSPGVRWAVVTSQIKAAVIVIGTEAIPALVRLAQPLVAAIHWFNGLSESTKHTIAVVAVLGSAISVISGTFVIVTASVVKLAGSIKLLRLTALGAEAGAATPQVMILVAAMTALGYILVKHPTWIMNVVHALGGLKTVLMIVGSLVGAAMIAKLLGFSGGLINVFKSAQLASGEVSALRLGLLRLTLIGAITIPIILAYSSKFDKDPRNKSGAGKILSETLGRIPVIGSVAKAGGELGASATDALGLSKKSKDEARQKKFVAQGQQFISSLGNVDKLQYILNSPYASDSMKWWAKMYYGQSNYAAVASIAQKVSKIEQISKARSAAANDKTISSPAAKKAIRAVNDETYMAQLKNVSKLDMLYQGHKSLANYRKFQTALAALNATYSTQLYQNYTNDYLNQVESADKKSATKRASNTKAAYDKAVALAKNYATQVSDALSSITDTYNNILQQNQTNFGALFSGPYLNSPMVQARLGYNNQQVTPGDVLKDLKQQLSHYNTFSGQLTGLSKRGAPQALIDQLNAVGPSAPGAPNFIAALSKLSPAAFKNYIDTWNKAQATIKTNTINQLNAQLAQYKKFGSKVALAIISGMKSLDAELENQLKATLERLFPAFVDLENKSKIPKAPSKTSTPSNTTHNTDNSTHDNSTHVYNPVTEDLQTTISKNNFINRNKRW